MSLTIWPTVDVEACGAKWTVGHPVRGGEMVAAALGGYTISDGREIEASGDLAAALSVYFVEAVRGWSDVLDAEGKAVPFSTEAAEAMPLDVKSAVVQAAIARRTELQGNATGPGE